MGSLSGIEIIYWAATVIGGTLFILRTVMMLAGAGGDHDGDFHMDASDVHIGDMGDAHLDADTGGVDHSDELGESDFSFKLLSMQGVTAFFMMFGLVGLALLKADLVVPLTVLGGVLAGLFAVLLISILFAQMKRLQSEGTIQLKNAIGESGSVYLNIPAGGSGQAQVAVQGAMKIYDAVAADQEVIKTGEKIRVVGIVDHKTLIVEKIAPKAAPEEER